MNVNINLNNVDWVLLREQKLWLIEAMSQLKSGDELLADGLLGLLDDIQNQAALTLGEDVVFGDFKE